MEMWGLIPMPPEQAMHTNIAAEIKDWTEPKCENTTFFNIAHIVYQETVAGLKSRNEQPLDSALMVSVAQEYLNNGRHY
jgi:hypothetical protein